MRRGPAGLFAVCLGVAVMAGCQRAQTPPPTPAVSPVSGTLVLNGLSAPVRVLRDRWGVAHITASSTDDLFFAQGFVQAEDRLFQMDLWRRSAQGRLAEVLGSNFVGRDAMTRRVQYRGDPEQDWAGVEPETRAIATAFVRGINAWVAIAREHPPEAFVLAGWRPEFWRPHDLLNRTDAFVASGDAMAEVFRARLVAAVGGARAAALLGTDLQVPPGMDPSAVTFQFAEALRRIGSAPFFVGLAASVATGSNAWVVAGRRSVSGAPIVATDPHRPLASPSTRYLVHLTAPGWNVAGATAPWLPGVAIGHNDRVAWGMTAFNADTQDIYVERLNPDNSHEIDDDGHWKSTTVIQETIYVKGGKPVTFSREYTPRGVVIAVDGEKHLAFTLRWSGFEPGAAGELGALALDRASSASEIRLALTHWKMPSVEVVFADRNGAVGSQVAALVPTRRGPDGRLPSAAGARGVAWDGWLSFDNLPHVADPTAGYIASANRSRARTERLRAALAPPRGFTVEDSHRLQQDVLAWNAEQLVPLFARIRAPRADIERAREQLLAWNRQVLAASTAAATYVMWERHVRRMLVERRVPADLLEEFVARTADLLVPALLEPSRRWFDGDVVRSRDSLVLRALTAAVDDLNARGGSSGTDPTWGALHTTTFIPPLAVTDAARRRFAVGPFPRSGYDDTILSTSGRELEASIGASFSAVFDVADWDRSVVQSAPGQSESPVSPHFADLSKLWAAGESFPLPFSESAISASAESTLTLVPQAK